LVTQPKKNDDEGTVVSLLLFGVVIPCNASIPFRKDYIHDPWHPPTDMNEMDRSIPVHCTYPSISIHRSRRYRFVCLLFDQAYEGNRSNLMWQAWGTHGTRDDTMTPRRSSRKMTPRVDFPRSFDGSTTGEQNGTERVTIEMDNSKVYW